MTNQEYVDLVKSTALKLGHKLVIQYLVAQFPFFAFPIVGTIAGFIVDSILNILIKYTEFAAFFAYTDLRVDQQGRDFLDAAIKNRDAQLHGSPDDKKSAEQVLIVKFKSLAKFNT